MKNIIKLFAFSFLFVACDEQDITFRPYNAVSEQIVLRTEDDFKNMVNGAYAYMIKNGGAGGYGEEFTIDTEVMTSNVILKNAGRQTNQIGYNLEYVPNQSHFSYFTSAFRSADLASLAINQIDKLQPGATRDNIEGQARFIRALNMFDMARIYCKIPTQSADANSSLGMYYVETFTQQANPRLATVQETYAKILNDLLIAKDKIATNNSLSQGAASRSAVFALLSRVYLYMGDYPKVIEFGNLATNNATAAVCPRTSFANLWRDAATNGILFQLRIDQVDGSTPGVVWSQNLGASGIRSEYVAPKDFYDMYDATDIRKTAYFQQSNFNGIAYNHVMKYFSRLTGNPGILNIKVLRTEEVYLNMAEAQNKIDGGGLVFLDRIRAQRYTGFVSPNETGAALTDAIMKERRLELAFEMDRFFTLKRLGMTMTRNATQGDRADGTGVAPQTKALTLPAGDHRWQLPIPQSQIDINPSLQQNPGY